MKKMKLFGKFIIIVSLPLLILVNIMPTTKGENLYLRKSIYKFLQNKNNRRTAFSAAVKLHNGNSSNTCVYFASEVLRRNNYEVPKNMASVAKFIPFLEKEGWEKERDYKKLKPGDLCFSTDAYDNKKGIPTHTYIFMGWVQEGNYDYAYICDNQAKDYENKVYHIRNMNVIAKVNGDKKEAFSFFMKATQ
ncbi:hypothetical protein [Clostridium ganghwense]|uniref:Bacteriophage lysin domain-containing protein n=1 Tax=Clostridium ganghwense TaxID=312089 RepID=A0ABT4CU39_9CLOT|nr:hypothetical protein [Clostridium ganghwense]MCY6371726.1 hypothetical protein [Clostridium ganghwense]